MVAIVVTLMEHRRDISCLMMKSMHVQFYLIYRRRAQYIQGHVLSLGKMSLIIKTQFQIWVVCIKKCFREMFEELHL